jgi:hypothetical protein
MKFRLSILSIAFLLASLSVADAAKKQVSFAFYGDTISLSLDSFESIGYDGKDISQESIAAFYKQVSQLRYQAFVNHLVYYRQKNRLDDWFYYQLVRKTAQQLCAKEKNFELYTLYKWFLLCKSGYDAELAICDHRLLLYVRSDDNIYDIPFYKQEGKQYVCLNYHDYGSKIDFGKLSFFSVPIEMPEANKTFSYRVTRMPEFNNEAYAERDLQFQYEEKNYTFKVLVNTEVQNIFVNYPVVDYEAYFNIPLSKRTYNSLIPELREAVKGMNQKKGVDYLMRFSRNAFAYKTDQDAFGKEKRLSPEQTLLNSSSDCDDRAALFFALVKELYNLPMIVVLYPKHVTIAVQFEKAQGKPIVYKEKKYYICEPTPQPEDLPIGHVNPKLRHTPYEIAYEYNPEQ